MPRVCKSSIDSLAYKVSSAKLWTNLKQALCQVNNNNNNNKCMAYKACSATMDTFKTRSVRSKKKKKKKKKKQQKKKESIVYEYSNIC